MGLNLKSQAESLFAQIGYGRENAIPRPANKSIDRFLREMVARANESGDVVINVGEGYYRPRPWIAIEKAEYKEYVAKDVSRAMRLLRKKKKMQHSYDQMEVGHDEMHESYQQLRLEL